MTFTYEIGIAAGICFVVSLALLNFGVLTAKSPIYQTLNLLGALGFTYTAISPFNPGLFITESIWALVALLGLWAIWRRRPAAAPETGLPLTETDSA